MVRFFFFSEREDSDTSVYDEKYIIAEVTARDGTQETHFVTMRLPYHSMIADSYRRRLDMVDGKRVANVNGGGIVRIDGAAKKLETYGRSGGYGPPDLAQVREVLEGSLLKDDAAWQLDLTVTDYIRG